MSDAATKSRATRWTDDQLAAIEARGSDAIVTAAAGSGKTATLTERVYRLVAQNGPNGAPPDSLDELLVITFTRKAAREMRRRIEERLLDGLRADPKAAGPRAALEALPRANITTIDAFCDRLVRRHFQRAGAASDFRTADAEEEREIVGRAMERVFERLARGEGEAAGAFLRLAEGTVGERRMGALEALERRIESVRRFRESLVDPAAWTTESRRALEASLNAASIDALADAPRIVRAMGRSLGDLAGALRASIDRARELGAESNVIEDWKALVESLKARADRAGVEPSPSLTAFAESAREWLDAGDGARLLKLGLKANCGATLYRNEAFRKAALERFGARVSEWRNRWFALGVEEWLEASRLAARRGLDLLDLADAVQSEIDEAKRRRRALGFADVARRALDLLRTPGGEPSEVALHCRESFKHVLVDEFQDVSPIQDALIAAVARPGGAEGGGNLFIVGDQKQSIYRFRRADPSIFQRRVEACDGAGARRIDLRRNFRSRPGVLECVNSLFERWMDRELGGIEYDERARLTPDREAAEDDPVAVELALIAEEAEDENEESLEGVAREARWIAARIGELTHPENGATVPDRDAPGDRRRARPGDCAILLRKFSTDAEIWLSELARAGVRARAAGRHPLLDAPELLDVFHTLRLADQPFQDVSLAAVLRSPAVGLNETDLLRIRLGARGGPFHEAVWRAAGRGPVDGDDGGERIEPLDEGSRARLGEFFARVDEWRRLAVRGAPEAVLEAIVAATRIESRLAGLPDAAAQLRALDELREMARKCVERSGGAPTLAGLIRAIDPAERFDAGEEDAGADALEGGAVHLMTVHKSKGLEFPIVFLARLGSPVRRPGAREEIELAADRPIACVGVDAERRVRLTPPALIALREEEDRERRAEELRLLYVAMTRARERLIMVGTPRKGARDRWPHAAAAQSGPTPALWRTSADSMLDLIGPALDAIAREAAPAWLRVLECGEPPAPKEKRELSAALEWARRPHDESLRRAAIEEYIERFGRDPRESAGGARIEAPPTLAPLGAPGAAASLPFKVFASGLHREAERWRMNGEDASARESGAFGEEGIATASERGERLRAPKFVEAAAKGALDARARGTLAHEFLRRLDLSGDLSERGLKSSARAMWEAGALGAIGIEDLDAIPFAGVAAFFRSPLGRRAIERPGAVSRELPVTSSRPAREFLFGGAAGGPPSPGSGGQAGCATNLEGEFVLVQGMVDAVIDEGDFAVVIDYKTDRIGGREDVERLKRLYAPQLAAYAEAVARAWGIVVPEAYLVFLNAGEVVMIEDACRLE